jgi:undecaprenyl-diphosphatase
MTAIQAIALAVVQGLTEFLPVSSKTHLALTSKLMGLHEIPLDLVVTLHLGTLAAVLIFYRRDLWAILSSLWTRGGPSAEGEPSPRDYRRLLLLLILGTVPAAVAGALFEDRIEALLNDVRLEGAGLLVTALILFLSSRARGTRDLPRTRYLDALLVGCGQAAALLPGISRSGSTIVTSLACGLDRQWAPRFSFLLSVPVILGGAALKAHQMQGGQVSALFDPLLYALAAVIAAIVGYLAILLVTGSVRRGNLIYFAGYCLGLGLAVLLFGVRFLS